MIPGQGRSLGREDPLEEATATHFSILAWRIPWIEEPGGLQSMGSQRVVAGPLRLTHTHTHTHVIGLCFRLPRMRNSHKSDTYGLEVKGGSPG